MASEPSSSTTAPACSSSRGAAPPGATGPGWRGGGGERPASARAESPRGPRPAPRKPANLVPERTRQKVRATSPLTRREVVGADLGDHAHGAPEGADAVFAQDQPE